MALVLVVDDDENIRELISLYLRNEGIQTLRASNGMEALKLLEKGTPDLVNLVIVDIMMPEMDGWELCREIKVYWDLPVLMVTARGEMEDKIKGFHLGTDDYIVKPFDPQEMVLRVKALLRRYHVSSSQVLHLGKMTLNRLNYVVNTGQDSLTLPLKEFELLFTFASHTGQIFTRGQLIELIWGIDYEGDERTVDVHVKRLRERFPEEEAWVPFKITTVRGLGYRLEGRTTT